MDIPVDERSSAAIRRFQLQCCDCWCSAGFQHGLSRVYGVTASKDDESQIFRWFFLVFTFLNVRKAVSLTEDIGFMLPATACYFGCTEQHFDRDAADHWSVSVLVGCLPTGILGLRPGSDDSDVCSFPVLVDTSMVTLKYLRRCFSGWSFSTEVPDEISPGEPDERRIGDNLDVWVGRKVAFIQAGRDIVVSGDVKFGGVFGYPFMLEVLARQRGKDVNLCCDADAARHSTVDDGLSHGTNWRPILIADSEDENGVAREGSTLRESHPIGIDDEGVNDDVIVVD